MNLVGDPTLSNALITTFYVNHECYGIEVNKVQEVTKQPKILEVPLAPKFIKGLINLRGQLATAVGLRELFGAPINTGQEQMSVVCRENGQLISLIVDSIGDVIEASGQNFESTPETLPSEFKHYIKGIYKINDALVSIIDLDKIAAELFMSTKNNEMSI